MRKLILVSLAAAIFVSVAAFAQETPKPGDVTPSPPRSQEPQKPASPDTTVTGCVQKGDKPGEVSITAEDGRIWELHSTTSKLDEHINHKVTVTGTATRDTTAEAKKEGQVENASANKSMGTCSLTA